MAIGDPTWSRGESKVFNSAGAVTPQWSYGESVILHQWITIRTLSIQDPVHDHVTDTNITEQRIRVLGVIDPIHDHFSDRISVDVLYKKYGAFFEASNQSYFFTAKDG